MRFQRDTGLLGVLVVHDELPLNDVVDTPEEYTMVLQELTTSARSRFRYCLPGGIRVPFQFGDYLNFNERQAFIAKAISKSKRKTQP